MKTSLRPSTIEWIMVNVFTHMDFEEAYTLGSLMDKVINGASCVYITEEYLTSIVNTCIRYNVTNSPVFYYLCGKLFDIKTRKIMKANQDRFCIRFDNAPSVKIPSIKAMRELIRNDVFIGIERGRVYDSGLKEMKEAVEDGIVLGPYDKEQIGIIKAILSNTPYFVEKYVGQKTLNDVQF